MEDSDTASSRSSRHEDDCPAVKVPKKKAWAKHEDTQLMAIVAQYGPANWDVLSKHLPNRSGKQCRERYHNILDPKVRKGDWSLQEDEIILALHQSLGNQWAKIARGLQGRTDNAVKNRYYAITKVKSPSRGHFEDLEAFYNLCLIREGKKTPTSADSSVSEASPATSSSTSSSFFAEEIVGPI